MPLGPALALEYRSILVPIVSGDESREAVELAARLATERAGRIVLLRVIVVPLELPLDADLSEQLEEADVLLDEARAIATPYGVRARRARRARAATPAARSSRRPTGAAPRSSSSARRAAATGTSSGTRSTSFSSRRRAG